MNKRLSLILITIFSALVFSACEPLQLPSQKKAGLQIEYGQGEDNASVFLNEQYLEKAPLAEKNILAGNYILKIVPEDQNLAEFTTPIELEPGTLSVVVYNPKQTSKTSSATIYELKKRSDLKKEGAVHFETYPENAFITFDGSERQYSPLLIDHLEPGDHQFTVNLPSYEAQEHNFQVIAGYETKITVNLAKNSSEQVDEAKNDLVPNNPQATIVQEKFNQGVSEASVSSQILGAKVKIKSTGLFIEGEEVLRVRAASSSSAAQVGYAKSNYFYPYLGPSDNDSEWLEIQFAEEPAWISSDFAEIVAE